MLLQCRNPTKLNRWPDHMGCRKCRSKTNRREVTAEDPIALFGVWLAQARESEPNDPEAMALATTAADGQPHVRMVLLKGVGREGFTFYTNDESAKGSELAANPRAALLFHWKS